MDSKNTISFSVDAGIINRLGLELVGRSETAVSELIKNSYDADATNVEVSFENTNTIGGTIIIDDNGEGMNLESLKNGFMRLSSTDKIHNPISKKFSRKKAGKKGIGRFSTQRLGQRLIIITKQAKMTEALKLIIEWNDYTIDCNLESVSNKFEYVLPIKNKGTRLIIENLREAWGAVEIRRVYRYVSDLLQPNYISDRTGNLNIAKTDAENFFSVCFKQTNAGKSEIIAEPTKMVFDKAIATIEGYVDSHKDGYCSVFSKKFDLDDIIPISANDNENSLSKFIELKDIHFKAYYFIYNRKDYYDFDSNFTQLEYKGIQKMASESSGIRLYRNGFRVLPYGEKGNDWLNIDGNLSKKRYESGLNIPFNNNNLFGFVEIIDQSNGEFIFDETANREGLIENLAFKELNTFLFKVLRAAMFRIASAEELLKAKRKREERLKKQKNAGFQYIKNKIKEVQKKIENSDPDREEHITLLLDSLPQDLDNREKEIKKEAEAKIEELGMLRVLAGTGLVIGEFVHEIEQFDTIFQSKIKYLKKNIKSDLSSQKIKELEKSFKSYQSYTGYFRTSMSQNVKRNIVPINMKKAINDFLKQIENNSRSSSLEIKKEYLKKNLITCPMHPSEWLSILFNLYTNSKKAIHRNSTHRGKILIKVNQKNNKIILQFQDNGDGIPEDMKNRIFAPFFTTANPINQGGKEADNTSGTGLGLYIVKNIVNSYNGSIVLDDPDKNYNTNFVITLPI